MDVTGFPAGTTGTYHFSVGAGFNNERATSFTYCGSASFGSGPATDCSVNSVGSQARIIIGGDPLGANEVYEIVRNGWEIAETTEADSLVDMVAGVNHFSVRAYSSDPYHRTTKVYCGNVSQTDPLTPTTCRVQEVDGVIRVSWNGAEDADAFRVYRLGKGLWRTDPTRIDVSRIVRTLGYIDGTYTLRAVVGGEAGPFTSCQTVE